MSETKGQSELRRVLDNVEFVITSPLEEMASRIEVVRRDMLGLHRRAEELEDRVERLEGEIKLLLAEYTELAKRA